MWYLAADIGGTNSRLLAVNSQDSALTLTQVYRSEDYPDLTSILRVFLQEHAIQHVDAACFAVAGPVSDGQAKITNLPWQLDAEEIMQAVPVDRLLLVNDFIGVASGIPALNENDYVTLQAAQADPEGTIAILGAGTGLGEAILVFHEGRRVAVPSEGGHVDFAPRDEEEIELLRYWQKRTGRVSYESFLSGQGIHRLFEFYCNNMRQPAENEIVSRLQSDDPAAVITEYATTFKHPVALATMQRFVQIYAAQSANLALTCKATGGVYLAGGIAPRIVELMQSDLFIATFNDKKPMNDLMSRIPVRLVMNTRVGLLGALELAKQLSD